MSARNLLLLGAAFLASACNDPQSGPPADTPDLAVAPSGDLGTPQTPPAFSENVFVAGAMGGPGSADGAGDAARFYNVRGAVYADGVLYIADSGNQTIRRMDPATGTVTTLAGRAGTKGSQDGTGAAARFTAPDAIAADGAGNLFVTDTANSTIRKIVVATGAVTTLAGKAESRGSDDGVGEAARFNQPDALVADGAGNLYVADTVNHTIRKVVVATGAVTTLAGAAGMRGDADGTTQARFNRPAALALSADGKTLFIGDSGNHTIRQLVLATGEVTTLAGTPKMSGSADGTGAAARFLGPSGLAVVGDDLIIADSGNHTLRRLVLATREVTTIAGAAETPASTDGAGTAARFSYPAALAADGAGNLFVADSGNHLVRKVALSGMAVVTAAGRARIVGSLDGVGAAAQMLNPSGIARDDDGNVYVTDSFNFTIRKIVVSTGAVTTLAGAAGQKGADDGTGAAARFTNPTGLAFEGGMLYVADSDNDTIRRVDVATGAVTTLAGTAGNRGTDDGVGDAASFARPSALTVDGSGNLYVADTVSSLIRKVVIASGEVTTLAGSPGKLGSDDGVGDQASFNLPGGIVYDGAGGLFVADTYNHLLRHVSIADRKVTTVGGATGMNGHADGAPANARFAHPSGLALDPSGALFITDLGSHTVRRLYDGQVTTVAGVAAQGGVRTGALPAGFNRPLGLTLLPGEQLAVLSSAENVLTLLK